MNMVEVFVGHGPGVHESMETKMSPHHEQERVMWCHRIKTTKHTAKHTSL